MINDCPNCTLLRKELSKANSTNIIMHANYTRSLEEIREIYAGMDGFVPETCPEGYQQRLLKQMYDIAVKALKED